MDAPTFVAQDPKSARRRSEVPEKVAPHTMKWLAELPEDVRPQRLPIEYTRIANVLGRLWPKPRDCLAYLDELLLDRRGDRHGFPLAVAMELAGLKDHYETVVHHVPQTVWDQIIERHFA